MKAGDHGQKRLVLHHKADKPSHHSQRENTFFKVVLYIEMNMSKPEELMSNLVTCPPFSSVVVGAGTDVNPSRMTWLWPGRAQENTVGREE